LGFVITKLILLVDFLLLVGSTIVGLAILDDWILMGGRGVYFWDVRALDNEGVEAALGAMMEEQKQPDGRGEAEGMCMR
jgi:hypothetical protein